MSTALVVVGVVAVLAAVGIAVVVGVRRLARRWSRPWGRVAGGVAVLGLVLVVVGAVVSPTPAVTPAAAPTATSGTSLVPPSTAPSLTARTGGSGSLPASTSPAATPTLGTPPAVTPAVSSPAATPAPVGSRPPRARVSRSPRGPVVVAVRGLRPDHRLTPGAVFGQVTAEQVCTVGYSARVRDVTTAQRHRVFDAYGIPYTDHAGFEVDHLVPLELGGSNATANLWPQKGSIPNPKDTVENRLHDLVCAGRVGLGVAQRAIAADWVAAGARYTGVPVPPTPAPTHRATPPPSPSPTEPTPAPPASAPPAGQLDPRFGTCTAAIAAGYGPYTRGLDPEYAWYIDRDHDGVDCE